MQRARDDGGSNGGALKRRRWNEAGRGSTLTQDSSALKHQHAHQCASDRSYGDVDVHENATVLQGDNYGSLTINHSQQPPQHKSGILLESLPFDRMDARLRNVATALPDTCQWLLGHRQFAAWVDNGQMREHYGFLWVKGKPGSGKSTIMKETVAWAERAWFTQIILTYFFNARSPNELEKSSLGLYRSLLHQLLSAHPGGRALFVTRFASKERDGKMVENWTETELQNFLIELVTTRRLPPITVFIDALDEGSCDDIRSMVTFLERLTRSSISAGAVTRVCLSSRHYPHISIRKGLLVVVEDQCEHQRDIEVYIRSELAGNESPQMDELRRKVRDRSAGIFLWVVVVVTILNKAYDEGKKLAAMLKMLDGIPPDLHDLFGNTLSRESEGMDECVTLIRWVLFSLRPLSPVELYIAVQQTCLSEDINHSTTAAQDRLVRYLLHCSRGLVELTPSEPSVVQFIHETVRDFLTGENVLGGKLSTESETHVALPNFQADSCHMMMAESCLQYLLDLCQKRPLTEEILQQYSLAEYTARYWWQHMRLSNILCNQRLLDLALRLFTVGSNLLTWVQLYNINSDSERSDPLRAVDDVAPPLYYTASIGIAEIVSGVLLQRVDVNAQGGVYGNALQAASVYGHEKVVQMLLDKGADVDARGGVYGNALQAASVYGHEKVVQILLDKGADVNAQGGKYSNALQAALYGGHEKVVQMLLDKDVDVNTRGGMYGNVL